MADKQFKYKILLQMLDQASETIKSVGDELKKVQKQATETSNTFKQVPSAAAPKFNMLGNSIQQVARELPSLAIGANTFFLAISNNLPMLMDSITAVRKENQQLIASGAKAVPVWKQVASSLFSWNTALTVGITLLSVYGKDVTEFITKTFLSTSAIDAAKKVQEQLNEVREKGVNNAQKEITKLNVLYNAALSETRSKSERVKATKELQITYPDYFRNLAQEEIMTGKAASAYDKLTKSLTNAAIARASMDRMTENATKLIDLTDQKEILQDEIKQAETWLQQLAGSMRTTSSQTEQQMYGAAAGKVVTLKKQLQSITKEIDFLTQSNEKLSSNIDISALTDNPQRGGKRNKLLNDNLKTLGGIEYKIKTLKDTQACAMGDQAIALEKEIRLWEEKLRLMQNAITIGAANRPDITMLSAGKIPTIKNSNGKVDNKKNSLIIPIKIDETAWKTVRTKFKEEMAGLQQIAVISGEQIGNMLTGGIQSFAASIGNALGSGNGIDVFTATLSSLMDMLQQFGASLIATGMAAIALQSVLLNPFAAIAAGTALVTAASAAKAALQNITAFADGGIVSGPTLALVGEYSGASNNPEVIAPLDKLKSLIELERSSNDKLYLETKIKGKDLYVAIRKVEREINRTR